MITRVSFSLCAESFVQARHHQVVEVVVSPNAQEKRSCADKHSLDATDVRDEVQHVVYVPLYDCLVQVPQDLDHYMSVWSKVLWVSRECIKAEDGGVFELCKLVQVHQLILQVNLRIFDFKLEE